MTLLKRSNGVFYLKYFTETGEKRISTKCRKKSEARIFLEQFREKLNAPKISVKSLQCIKNEYFNYLKVRCTENHLNAVKYSIEKFINCSNIQSISEFNKNNLENFIAEQIVNSISSAHLTYKHIKAFLNYSLDNDYISFNPMTKIKFPRIPEKENIFIDSDEFNSILENEDDELLRNIYTFAYHSGMRLSEITNCKRTWINLEQRIITIINDEEFTSKNKKSRVIPINNILLKTIMNQGAGEGYLFSKIKGVKLNNDFVSKRFKKVVRKTFGNSTKIHFHNLRGSFGSELIRKGVSSFYVMKLLGHSSLVVTEKNYLSLRIDDLKEAVNKLAS